MDKNNELIRLGEVVKKLRLEKGYSQTHLANIIGKDQPSVNRLEKGRINPSYIYLLEICEGLEIDINELLSEI